MKVLSIIACLVVYLLLSRAALEVRIKYLENTAGISMFVLFVFAVCLVLGLGYGDVSLFLSSAFAVIGVALFAQWSILSNITASMVIFFGFPYRVGDRIKVTDADFDISGTVEEISLFHVLFAEKDT